MTRKSLLAMLLLLGSSMTMAADALRVGLSPDYPPLAFQQDGQIVGVEADNARAVGEIIGRKISLLSMPFEKLMPALLAGEIDVIMSGFSVTGERSAQVLFTDSYMLVGQMAILHRDKIARFAQPWSIYRPGVRVGVEPGTTGAAYAERELKEAEVKFYQDSAAAFAGLRADEIDLYIHDAPTSWQLATSRENADLISLYSPMTEEMLAWAVRPGDDVLAGELNRALRVMKTNGTLQYILNRWIPVRVEVR
ncbi:MAG: transporter substrate-binding domain-containing protein [Halioglobus sp.]|nr:transporter substrate-binding domain-containing protein [Halioglobus sp.]MCB1707896.1 transporter substrate-binding domain-containing protein [Halioglobus sp.]MCP5122113.1 transporter substrate-binding domain-containing protein [Pseudomonadales bacterium]MCP5192341.1 transporter substrate-binding domain-containing protein [Pseudomonadales bacterium]